MNLRLCYLRSAIACAQPAWMVLMCAAFVGAAAGLARGEETGDAKSATLSGEQIYKQRCASCHGPQGEGVPELGGPLRGDRPRAALATFIDQQMPEGDPEACSGDEARRVADFVYDAFYSPIAQARNNPPRIELSRLTVRQYHATIADLVASFRHSDTWGEQRGLKAEYFNSGRRINTRRRVLERIDAQVDFDYGEKGPAIEKLSQEEFAGRWSGGLLAPRTGQYDLIVRTDNGARLWLNDNDEPLIDAWVKSGDQTEYRASIRLLAGRVYPIRLEFFKNDKDPRSSIALAWRPPQGVESIVPADQLSPGRFAEVLVLSTKFPPDDRTLDYERGASVSKEWDEATTYAALETARYLAEDLERLAGVKPDVLSEHPQVKKFCESLVETAFRRPLSDEQRQFFVDRQCAAAANAELAVKRVTLLALKSPRFLYLEPSSSPPDAYDVATRIAYTLWDSLPDRQLLEAAQQNKLQTREQVASQVDRMLDDRRARIKLRSFLHGWLNMEHLGDLSKDDQLYPEFTPEVIADLRTSLDLFLDDVLWSETSDFRQLLAADSLYLNGRLAKVYGADLAADADFRRVVLSDQPRAGVLSHPLLMAGFAYRESSSPIHRGVFLVRNVLGRTLRPPPVAVSPEDADLHPDMTTRERIARQTQARVCQGCHDMINPLGFSLENFDALGRYRTEENRRPIDTSGTYQRQSGEIIEFRGAPQLAAHLAGDEEVHAAFAEQMFHYLVKQPVRAYGSDQPDALRKKFAEGSFHMRNFVREIVLTAALHRPSPETGNTR